jgi:Na+/melibiose symporter-like transporter
MSADASPRQKAGSVLGAAPESGHEAPHSGAAPQGADLRVRLQVAYGTGSLFTSIFGTLPQVVLLFYMTSVLGITPALAGAVVLVPKLFEVVFDPLLGLWSDSLRSPWGRRRPLMAAGVVGIALSMPWLFNPVVYEDSSATALHVGLVFFACTLAYSLFFVPYLSLPTEMTDRPDVRTRLMAWRIGFLSAGVLTAGAGAPWIVKWAGSGLHGYAVMGWIFTAICVLAMVIALAGTAKARLASPNTHSLGIVQQLRLVRANRPFVLLAAAYGLQVCGQGAFAASLPYFIAHVLQRPPQTAGVFFLCVTGTALIVLAPWVMAARRLSKRTAYLWASAVYASASLWAWTYSSTTDLAVMLLGFVVLGIGFGGMELFSHAMLPDAAEEDRAHSGMNREALFSGVWIATEKLGFALGAGVVAALLHWGHYQVAGGQALTALQPDSAVTAIRIAAAAVPAAMFLLSMPLIARYALTNRSALAAPHTAREPRA